MLAPLFLRTLWKRLTMSMSPSSLQLAGLWDAERLRPECDSEVQAWRDKLLIHSRREALLNGVVVTKVEHLKDSSDAKWQHEFLRIHVLHEATGEALSLIVDRDFWPRDLESPPERDSEAEAPCSGKNRKKPSFSSKRKHQPVCEVPPTGDEQNDLDEVYRKKDVPEEKGLSLVVTHVSGKVVHFSGSFFSDHKALDRVHRGVRDLEKWRSPDILDLQTLTFPEGARPPVIKAAIFIAALSEFAPRYHVGEFQCFWFARAACDGLAAEFKGHLADGRHVRAMGKWKTALFKYTNPSKSIQKEYTRATEQFEKDFQGIQSEGHQRGIAEGRQEGIEERRRLEEENAQLRAALAAR